MDYTLDFLVDKKVVCVKMKGRLSFQIAEHFSREAVKLARHNDCNRFLFDHTETNMSGGVNKIHASGEELQEFGFKNTDRVALIISNYEPSSSFLEPVSHNSRWSSIKYFSAENTQEAYNWLLEIK